MHLAVPYPVVLSSGNLGLNPPIRLVHRLGDWVERDCWCLYSTLPPSLLGPESALAGGDLSAVPEAYHDIGDVFLKQRARMLPPHLPYDCAINLLPGAPLPCSWLDSLSKPEWKTMERYLSESLAAGLICPSSSPVGAGLF